ncbi:hypothetical protein WA026_008583 [Henosepilachna vigintioctopunctata]|uniref:Methyltransferase type 12 domain-containing protein n=1 Tax=Henosepilachna vigintioctopunctata TaxID=420089 RepID=A0AAW1UHS6_9CUCU
MSFSPSKFSQIKFHFKYVPEKLRNYLNLYTLHERENWKMLDIGSGPGHILSEVLPVLPTNYEEILCIDNEADMVNYLNSVNTNPRISSRQLDIETKNLPNDLKEHFDFAFSSNCLMYIGNYRQAFSNVNQILKPNGELFFIWCKMCPVKEIYCELSQTEKWNTYFKDFRNWKSHFNTEHSMNLLENICQFAELDILKVEELNNLFIEYDGIQSFINIFDSLDFMSGTVPKRDFLEYKRDYHKLMMSYITTESATKEQTKVKLHFPSMVLAAKKTNGTSRR